jgi:hypothetical protein
VKQFLCGAALLLALMAPAEAQDLNVNLFINYGFAHRDGAWAPVEVMVNNRHADLEGAVEVRTFDHTGRMQSPIYRVPMESPRDSVKRFKLHCMLANTESIEVRLFNGRREVSAARARVKIQAIGRDDFLCLVLDDTADGYGFLSTSLYRDSEEAGSRVSFFRHALDSASLARLADYPQCYMSFDLIVMGNIDPERMSSHHRGMIEQYVRDGGVVVVCAGAHASRLRGSWVETLAGVSMGPPMVYDEASLAEAVFGDAAGGSPGRSGVAARLTPAQPGMRTVGSDPVLAALRPLGSGHVATLAIDMDSGLLQSIQPYQALWRDLSNRRNLPVALSFDSAAGSLLGGLSRVAGVELVPMGSVVAYLVVYFLLAIVGNWLFWSWMKRREYAWLCLVIFSIGFTSYAMIYGTQGRAKQTELEEIEVLRMRAHAPGSGVEDATAAYTGFAGILARGSGRFEGVLSQPDALADDLELMSADYYYTNRMGTMESRPFTFVQERPGRVEDLAIGASEMRFLRIDGRVTLAGGIEAAFRVEDGVLAGELVNRTGLPLEDCFLVHGGLVYALNRVDEGHWSLHTDPGAASLEQFWGGLQQNYYYYDPDFQRWRTQFRGALLQNQYNPQMRSASIRPGLPPLVIGFVNAPALGGFAASEVTRKNLQAVMLVAQVDMANPGATAHVLPLPVEADRRQYGEMPRSMLPPRAPVNQLTAEQLRAQAALLEGANNVTLQVLMPDSLPRFAHVEIEIWVGAQGDAAGQYLESVNVTADGPLRRDWPQGIALEAPIIEGADGMRFRRAVLTLEDLDFLAQAPVLLFQVDSREMSRELCVVYAFARLVLSTDHTQEEFTLWQ